MLYNVKYCQPVKILEDTSCHPVKKYSHLYYYQSYYYPVKSAIFGPPTIFDIEYCDDPVLNKGFRLGSRGVLDQTHERLQPSLIYQT